MHSKFCQVLKKQNEQYLREKASQKLQYPFPTHWPLTEIKMSPLVGVGVSSLSALIQLTGQQKRHKFCHVFKLAINNLSSFPKYLDWLITSFCECYLYNKNK